MHEKCLIISTDPKLKLAGPGMEPGTFGLTDPCSTTESTLLREWSQITGRRKCSSHAEGGGGVTTSFKVVLTLKLEVFAILIVGT